MDSSLGLALLFCATGLLFAALGVPLMRERVPRNPWYGFRTRKTLASDAVWYPANRFMGRDLVASGLVTAVGSAALAFAAPALSPAAVEGIGLVLLLVPLILVLVRGFRHLASL